MTIQLNPEQLDYVNAKLAEPRDENSFLSHFLEACLRADAENYDLLEPIVEKLMDKYPAKPELLERERRDREARS